MDTGHYDLHLLSSINQGKTWDYESLIAEEKEVSFTETSLLETPNGDLVGFVRAQRLNGNIEEEEPRLQGLPLSKHISVIVRPKDGGKTFSWEPMGFFGFPFHALPLPDGRVWLTYGYRKKPFGIRGKFLNSECTDFSTAPEIILREDGGTADIGYPWSVLLADGFILTVYWFNENDGLRYIAGTFLK